MSYMFSGCSNLTTLDLSNFDTSNTLNMKNMFTNCNSLISLNLSHFNVSLINNTENMFKDVIRFKKFKFFKY